MVGSLRIDWISGSAIAVSYSVTNILISIFNVLYNIGIHIHSRWAYTRHIYTPTMCSSLLVDTLAVGLADRSQSLAHALLAERVVRLDLEPGFITVKGLVVSVYIGYMYIELYINNRLYCMYITAYVIVYVCYTYARVLYTSTPSIA